MSPRYREPYTLLERKTKSGKSVWYYRTYDENGKRTTARSTGLSTKTAARTYCDRLIKKGSLVPTKADKKKFNEYAQDWFIYEKCPYIKGRLARGGTYSRTHASMQKGNLDNHVIPFFGNKRLDDITSSQIEKWLFSLVEVKKLSPTSANHCFEVLQLILNEAERLNHINNNPIKKIRPLMRNKKKKGILTRKEVEALLNPRTIDSVWCGEILYYTLNLLAATTGARQGEILALKGDHVFEDYIRIEFSYDRTYGLKGTKTNNVREVPVPEFVMSFLNELKEASGDGFLFSKDGGENPIYFKGILKFLYRAFDRIGIDETLRKERNITFHSWRHFFNSLLRSSGIADSKTKRLTGHSTDMMQEHYTSFSREDYKDVLDVADSLNIKD